MHSEGGVPAGLANYDLIFSYPVWILGNYVIVAILAFIAFEANRQARNGISVLAIAAMMHTVTVELLFFFDPFTFTQSYLLYTIAAFSYLAVASGLSIWAARNVC